MVHSHYSFEIRQVRSHLFLTRPIYLKKRGWKDCNEFLTEISKLESVPEKISRIDNYLKQLNQEMMDIDLAKSIIDERIRIRSIKRRELEARKKSLLQTLSTKKKKN